MMFLEAFPLKHVVWILLKHSWCWGPTKCLDFAKCQILKEGLQTSVVEPLIQDQQFWILQNVESKHLKTDTCFPSEYKPGHSGSRMRHVFPSETFGRWENYFGMWEIYFGRAGWKIILAGGKIILTSGEIILAGQVGKVFWQVGQLFWQVGKLY